MVNFAKTSINEKGQLVADDFGDIYFSPINGLEETKYVFLQGNNLPERWLKNNSFTIIETGFGTGLNFLATWDLWKKTAHSKQKLHFISVEKYPLTNEVFIDSLQKYVELKTLSKILNKHYRSLIQTEVSSIQIDKNVTITLLIGDVKHVLLKTPEKADAWFLDGFSPIKNPNMWNSALYRNMVNASNKNATFATFTAASHVRNGLTEVGFNVSRIKGFAYKKHMSHGTLK